jgi:hypothetical protein
VDSRRLRGRGFAQRRRSVADVLEKPHHPDVVKRALAKRDRKRVSFHKRRVDPSSPEVSASEFELFLLNVDAEESDVREFLTEDREDGADSTADLEQPCSTLGLCAVADQPLSPMLCLLDRALVCVEVCSWSLSPQVDASSALVSRHGEPSGLLGAGRLDAAPFYAVRRGTITSIGAPPLVRVASLKLGAPCGLR